jgi:hypothetical protein
MDGVRSDKKFELVVELCPYSRGALTRWRALVT